jgi:hypothetical protein
MLNAIYLELLSVYSGRVHPSNYGSAYVGWGTTVERLVEEYLDQGGSLDLFRNVERLAEKKADWIW